MLFGPGKYTLYRDLDPLRPCCVDYASISAHTPSTLQVWVGNDLIESVYVGAYSPHTWWSGNSLLGYRELVCGESLTIEVGEGAIFRLESNLHVTVG